MNRTSAISSKTRKDQLLYTRRLLVLFLLVFSRFYAIHSQIVVNEIIYREDDSLYIEMYNNTSSEKRIFSIRIIADHCMPEALDINSIIQAHSLYLLKIPFPCQSITLCNIVITLHTDTEEFFTEFKGCVTSGESAGRFPDLSGEFIVYNKHQVSPSKSNYPPGILVKKTSKTNFSPRDSSPNSALYYDDHYWIFGGYEYDSILKLWTSKRNIWKSPDALDWELVNENPPFSQYSGFLAFNNKMMVYTYDSVYISENGVDWEAYLLDPQPWFEYLYYMGRYTVFKGQACMFNSNYIGFSEDGINWSFNETDIVAYSGRYMPAFVASEDKLWLYGGWGGFNDVWSSTNGLNWTKQLDEAPWQPRYWYNYTYFDEKLWMIAGRLPGLDLDSLQQFGNLQDVWYSSDGVNWSTLEMDTSSYHHRHASFLWNDGERVIISSGFGNNSTDRMYNDVWELSVRTMFLSGNDEKGLGLSIFPYKYVEYPLADTSNAKIMLWTSLDSFSPEETSWFDEKIIVGNGVDTTRIEFSNHEPVNLSDWQISANASLVFSKNSFLGHNPLWKSGSLLLFEDVYLPDTPLLIENAYELSVRNSALRINAGSSSYRTGFYNSQIHVVPPEPTVFKTSFFRIENSTTDDLFWLTSLPDQDLVIEPQPEHALPNLLIQHPRLFILQAPARIPKIRFSHDLLLAEQLNVHEDAQVILGDHISFSDQVFQNFVRFPSSLVIEQNSSLLVRERLNIEKTSLSNHGRLVITAQELILESYLENGGTVSISGEAALTAGLIEKPGYSELILTLEDPLSEESFLRYPLKLSSQDENRGYGQFRIFTVPSDRFSSDLPSYFRENNAGFGITIEKLSSPKTWLSFSLGITDEQNNPAQVYEYLFDTNRAIEYDISRQDPAPFVLTKKTDLKRQESYIFCNKAGFLTAGLIYPNPSDGILKIENEAVHGLFTLRISDLAGLEVYRNRFENNQLFFKTDLRSVLSSDKMYILTITNHTNKKTFSQRFLTHW
jgi:hypothetical protein